MAKSPNTNPFNGTFTQWTQPYVSMDAFNLGDNQFIRAVAQKAAQEEALEKEMALLDEIDARPVTDDAVADLEARLGYTRPRRENPGQTGPD